MFLPAQTMAIIGTVVIFLATHLRFNPPLTLNKNALKDDSLFRNLSCDFSSTSGIDYGN